MDYENFHWIADVETRLDNLERWRELEAKRRKIKKIAAGVLLGAVVLGLIVLMSI